MSASERMRRLKELMETEGLAGSFRTMSGYAQWRLHGGMYDEYAECQINAASEQSILTAHDVIIFQ